MAHRYACLLFAITFWASPRLQACPTPPQDAEARNAEVVAHFDAGRRASRAGQFDRAVEEYKAALRIDPDLTEAQVNLGLAYHALGQYALAAGEFQNALRQRPDLLPANLFLGIDLLKLGEPGKAISPLQAAVRLDSSNREARRALASTYLEQGQYGKAVEEFRSLSASESDRAESLYELGQSYLELARQLAGRMSQDRERSAWAKRLAGDLLAKRHLWSDAAVLYQKAIDLEPTQRGLHASLGSMYLHQAKLQAAEGEFRREIEVDPKSEQALMGLAELQLAYGAPQAALKDIAKISAIFPPFLVQQTDFPLYPLGADRADEFAADLENTGATPAKHFVLARLYKAAGEVDKASWQQTALEKEVAAWHESPATGSETAQELCGSHRYIACATRLQAEKARSASESTMLGEALLALAEDVRAADTFAGILSSEKSNLPATYWLARTYTRLADSYFARLIVEFPESWRAHQFRGHADQLSYAYDDAIEEFQSAIRSRPALPELHEALGRLYFLKKSYPRAEEELKTAVQLDPTRAHSLYLLGRLRLDRHEAQASIAYLRNALRYDPSLLEAHAALGQAYMRTGQVEYAVPELEKAAGSDTYGDLHYLLYVAYRKLAKNDLSRKALMRSQELRKDSAALHQEKVAEASLEAEQ